MSILLCNLLTHAGILTRALRECNTSLALLLTHLFWNSTRIGPELFAFASEDGDYTGQPPPTPEQQEFYKAHGFYLVDSARYYDMRPEVLESNFYAWRVTGDTKYIDRAASALRSFERYLAVNDAYAPIENVNDANSNKINDMESFWFAETLKYLYVITFQSSQKPDLMVLNVPQLFDL